MIADEFRRFAPALPETVENGPPGHPDVRARDRIFATFGHPDAACGMFAPETQPRRLRLYPEAMKPATGAWGRRDVAPVQRKMTTTAAQRGAIAPAWRGVALKTLVAQFDATHEDAAR